jgi:hypothetical protein
MSGFVLTSIAPDDLGESDERENRAINRPVIVADHEADTKGEIEALEDPDDPHQNHHDADQGADDPHHDIECGPHRGLPGNRTSIAASLRKSKATLRDQGGG